MQAYRHPNFGHDEDAAGDSYPVVVHSTPEGDVPLLGSDGTAYLTHLIADEEEVDIGVARERIVYEDIEPVTDEEVGGLSGAVIPYVTERGDVKEYLVTGRDFVIAAGRSPLTNTVGALREGGKTQGLPSSITDVLGRSSRTPEEKMERIADLKRRGDTLMGPFEARERARLSEVIENGSVNMGDYDTNHPAKVQHRR